MTEAMGAALDWLIEHNGTGVLTTRKRKDPRRIYMLAAGEYSPHIHKTWKRLEAIGRVRITGSRVTVSR